MVSGTPTDEGKSSIDKPRDVDAPAAGPPPAAATARFDGEEDSVATASEPAQLNVTQAQANKSVESHKASVVVTPGPAHFIDAIAGLDVDNQDDTDSAIEGLENMSSTASVRSSVYDYIEENGRRYHRYKEGQYLLPNDESEQDRLDLQHHLMILALDGKLHIAPIENMAGGLHNVMDIATGTGNWAIDFANAYRTASVIGTDLSPIQPEFIPSNCRFEIDDAEDDWLFPEPFDYIHGRALITCFKSHKTVFTHAFNALRSGGYFELQDCNLPLRFIDDSGNGTALETWSHRFMKGGAVLGKDFTRGGKYKEIMEEIGFVDVVEKRTQFPIGTWALGKKMKTLGAWMREDLLSGLEAISMAIMTRGLGMSAKEVEADLLNVKAELNSNKLHAYFPVIFIYGRKP